VLNALSLFPQPNPRPVMSSMELDMPVIATDPATDRHEADLLW